ncbi:MAG: DUF1700 domain-containing protein [Bacillota bacterium]|nr:DUF1700 domain-containing protein [Bacillota bacterium]
MNKEAFLCELREELFGLPQEDIDERISFYREMIDDRIEDGIPEEDAIAEIGTVESVKKQIMSEIPLARLVKEKVKPKRRLRVWEIVLLVLGSPVWIPLVIAAAAVIFAVYASIWALVVSAYAADLSLAAGVIAAFAGIGQFLKAGNPAGALFSFGAGVACAGLAILLFFACAWITKAVLKLSGRILFTTKSAFVGKEA